MSVTASAGWPWRAACSAQRAAGLLVVQGSVEQPGDPLELLLSQGEHAAATSDVVHLSQFGDHGREPVDQPGRDAAPGQAGHQRPRLVHQPLMRRSSQRRAAEKHEASAPHWTITASQHN
ncbi:MAG: hypothetical protein WCF33_21985 [Pseudonocardiaceae bacterium]